MAISLLHAPIHYIELSHDREGTVYERIQTGLNEILVIRYIHSVMKTPVYEYYRVMPDRRLLLTETEFSSYGAGLPEKGEYDFEITDKGFRVYNINHPFGFIVYRTAPIGTGAEITLIAGGEEHPLLSLSEERTPVRITIKKDPTWLFQIREGSKWLMKRGNPATQN